MRGALLCGLTITLHFAIPAACAEVRPNPLFADNAVLQQGRPVPVWGTADAGERVTVRFQGQTVSAMPEERRWRVTLRPLKAGGPFTLTIQGSNSIEVRNVMVGEVWIASGQSNMQWPVNASADAGSVMADSADTQLRLLTVPRQAADAPMEETAVRWVECRPDSVGDFSAVAYHFGRALRASLGVPVGLISTNYGGTPAESWTPREYLESAPELRTILEEHARRVADYPRALEAHRDAVEKARQQGSQPPRPPQDPSRNPQRPSGLYNAMIAPLIPYAIRGAIWYQGESNAGRARQYRTLFPTMIRSWREAWGQGDFPFLFVQLAPFMKIQPEPMESAWAELREAQLFTRKTVRNTAQAVIVDVGDENDIHPKQKQPVGERLALAALGIAYRRPVKWEGPDFDSARRSGSRMILRFRNAHGGLETPGGEPLKGFAIAGEDRRFVNAQARIEGRDRVAVWSDEVAHPVAVRYGWANYPVVNLRNRAGLWASPFRTDDWPLTTRPK